jgi:hypothetical protein
VLGGVRRRRCVEEVLRGGVWRYEEEEMCGGGMRRRC